MRRRPPCPRPVSLLLPAATLAILTGATSPARADGSPPLTRAEAREAALTVACGAPAVAAGYGRTLEALEQARWSSLREAVREDTIELAGDAVYRAASAGSAAPDPFRAVFGDVRPRESCTPRELERAGHAVGAARPPRRTELDRCAAAPLPKLLEDPACLFAMSARDALSGDHVRAASTMADLLAVAAFPRLYEGNALPDAERQRVLEAVATGLRATAIGDEDHALTEPLAHAFRGLDLGRVSPRDCKDDEPLARVFAGGSLGPQAAFCAATREALALDKVPVTVRGPGGERSTNLDALLRGTHGTGAPRLSDEAVVEELLCGRELPAGERASIACSSGRLTATKAASYKVLVGALAWSVEIAPAKERAEIHVASGDHETLAELLAGAKAVAVLRHDLAEAIHARLLGRDPKPAELRPLAVTAGRTWALAEAVEDSPLLADGHAELGSLLEHLEEAAPRAAPRDCKAPAGPLDRLLCAVREGGGLRGVLSAAEGSDVRAVAIRAASSALATEDARTCSRTATHRRLLVALASQIGADGEEESPSDEALSRMELDGAARDLVACASAGGASAAEDRVAASRVTYDLLPSPSLRFAYSSGYTNGVGGDGLRVTPSLDWLTARVRLSPRGAPVRVALQATLLDLAAPVAELAMRRGDLVYDQQGIAWVELLRPRLELTYAIGPHLALAAGASLRGASPFFGGKTFNPLAAPVRDRMIYLTPFHADARARDEFARFVEIGAGARWIF